MSLSATDIYQRQAPRFGSAADPIAYAVHLAFITNTFQLVGLDDDTGAADRSYDGLPGTWNINPALFTFRYRLDNVVVVVKCLLVDQTLLVHANQPGSDRILSLELVVPDYLQAGHDLNNPDAVYSNLNDLVSLINDRIVKELLASATLMRSATVDGRYRPYDQGDEYNDPLRLPRRPICPVGDFDGDLGPRPINPFRPDSGGSNLGPDHPMFARGRGQGRGRVPRFDPFGPDRGFSGDPNRDIFMPPEFGSGSGPGFLF